MALHATSPVADWAWLEYEVSTLHLHVNVAFSLFIWNINAILYKTVIDM